MALVATRATDTPIISPHMDDRMGSNINGPSLVKVPSWVESPLGKYYLYFAHHKGRYIRLAYSNCVEGPWKIHTPGVLDVSASYFETADPPPPPVHLRPSWATLQKGGYLYAHVASPHVLIDPEHKVFRMYFHGLLPNGDQQTRVSTSSDGLDFVVDPPLLGPSYFRVFKHRDYVYAVIWGGQIFRAPDWNGPFQPGGALVSDHILPGPGKSIRHCEINVQDDNLCLFFSCIGDAPEQIYFTHIDLSGDWESWQATDVNPLLEPLLAWEGRELPISCSEIGPSMAFARGLLDPCFFEDDDKNYLLYSGGAEYGGIGLSVLQELTSSSPDQNLNKGH
jgi:hypothetical protein